MHYRPLGRLQDKDNLMDCQGAQEEPREEQLPMLPIGFIGLPGSLWSLREIREPRKSQKEGQEDRGKVKEPPTGCFKVPWSSWPSFWFFLGSLAVHQAILILKPVSNSIRTKSMAALVQYYLFCSEPTSGRMVSSLDPCSLMFSPFLV